MLKIISRRSMFLFVTDIIVISMAFILASILCLGRWDGVFFSPEAGLLVPVYLFTLHFFDYYSPFRHFPPLRTLVEVLFIVAGSMAFAVAVFYLRPDAAVARAAFLGANIFIYAGLCAVRLLYDDLLGARIGMLSTVVLGDGRWAAEITRLLCATPRAGLGVVGIVTPSGQPPVMPAGAEIACLGTAEEALQIIEHFRVRCVVLAMEEKTRELENAVIERLHVSDVKIVSSLRVYEQITGKAPFQYFRAGHLLVIAEQVTDNLYLKGKRALDVLAALLLGIIFLPVVLVVGVILAVEAGGFSQVFFVQKRTGKGGKSFKMYKLRTMKDLPNGEKIVTRVGRWIRKYRLDEAPQLLNILKGDMSLVGPRPETDYFVRYCRQKIPFYNIIFSVRPGLSGWAQVKFAHTTNLADYETKFCYDLFYLKNCSLTIDLLVFFETIKVVLLGRGK